jgi:hypothetical protein
MNLPPASVRDLVVHENDLVAATHGRSFWILDDISSLRQIDSTVTSADVFLFKPATAIRMNSEAFQGTPLPPEIPTAKNPPDGAIIDYYLKTASTSEVTLEILDAANQVVRRYSTNDRPSARQRRQAIADIWITPPATLSAHEGLNRFVWDLRWTGGGENERGPQVLPGTYQARLTAAGQRYTQPLKVVLDPRSNATPADLAKQFDLARKVTRLSGQTDQLTKSLLALRKQRSDLQKASPSFATLIQAVDAVAAKIVGTGGSRVAATTPSGLGAVTSDLNAVNSVVDSADRMPPAQAYGLLEQVSRNFAGLVASWDELKKGKLAELNQALRGKNLPEIGPSQ